MRRKTTVAIEPRAGLAEYEPGRDALTLYSTTQVPGIVRNALSEALDLPGHRLRVVAPDVGGGFGGKGSLYPEEIFVCAAARQLGRSVKWTSDRMEDLSASNQAFDEIIDAELGLDRDGHAVALRADVIGDVGAYSVYPWTAGLEPVQVVSFLPGPYRIQHYRGRVRAVATSKAPTGPYRGVGRPIATFVMERLMDMAAARIGIDAKDIRAAQSRPAGGVSLQGRVGHRLGQIGLRRMPRRRLRQAIGYDDLRRKQAEARAAGRWYGIGIACYAELTGIGSRISVGAGHADQHRHRDRQHPHRFDRRGHRRVRRRLAWPGAGDHPRPGRRRASRRARRGRPHRARRQRGGARRHRHLCEPQHRAGRRRRAARRRGRAREGAQRRLASARSSDRRPRRERRTRDASPAPTVR